MNGAIVILLIAWIVCVLWWLRLERQIAKLEAELDRRHDIRALPADPDDGTGRSA